MYPPKTWNDPCIIFSLSHTKLFVINLGDRNSKVQVVFPKMEETGNTTSPSEAVTSTTNANSLSSDPLNFEPAPSHIDMYSNNPGQIEGNSHFLIK